MQSLGFCGFFFTTAAVVTSLGAISLGCADDESASDADTGAGPGGAASAGGQGGVGNAGAAGGGGAGGSVEGCHAQLGSEDGPRKVVIAHPFDQAGAQANAFEVLELSPAGQLTRIDTTFSMGRASTGVIQFTPDGEIGVAVQGDGTLGIFRFTNDGVRVVDPGFAGSFYAEWVVMNEAGDTLWVMDTNFPENGGGIYRVSLDCDGVPTDGGMVIPSKLARRAVWRDGDLVVAAVEISGAVGSDVHLLNGSDLTSKGAVDVFVGPDAIVGSLAVTQDGAYGLVGDGSGFSADPNAVGVFSLSGAPSFVQLLPPTEDPASIVASPFGNRAIIVSGFGDAIFEVGYDAGNAVAPFSLLGELSYVGSGPQLPIDAVMIERGALRGHVLVTEVSGVRQLDFTSGGVVDRGAFALGEDFEQIVGAIGVQP